MKHIDTLIHAIELHNLAVESLKPGNQLMDNNDCIVVSGFLSNHGYDIKIPDTPLDVNDKADLNNMMVEALSDTIQNLLKRLEDEALSEAGRAMSELDHDQGRLQAMTGSRLDNIFIASNTEFKQPWVIEGFAMVPPIEQLRTMMADIRSIDTSMAAIYKLYKAHWYDDNDGTLAFEIKEGIEALSIGSQHEAVANLYNLPIDGLVRSSPPVLNTAITVHHNTDFYQSKAMVKLVTVEEVDLKLADTKPSKLLISVSDQRKLLDMLKLEVDAEYITFYKRNINVTVAWVKHITKYYLDQSDRARLPTKRMLIAIRDISDMVSQLERHSSRLYVELVSTCINLLEI